MKRNKRERKFENKGVHVLLTKKEIFKSSDRIVNKNTLEKLEIGNKYYILRNNSRLKNSR